MYILLSLLAKCTCTTPGAGTAENNGYTCSDGFEGWCDADKECHATGEFVKGQWNDGCRVGMYLTIYTVS